MKDILFFSHNQKKIVEVKQIFKDSKIKVYDLNAFEKIKDPKETGVTFASNAKIKSKCGQELFKLPCFADDSGICIESLNWKPGVLSKRFLNNFKNKELCFKSIFKSIKNSGKQNAYFKTSISLTINKNQNIIFNGKIYGKISEKIKGDFGIGYDPIFIPKNYNKTLAELSTKDKNEISHRSIAVNKLINFLSN